MTKNILPQLRVPVRQDSILETTMKRAKYGIAGMRSGTMLLKQAEYI
jgi:hypothetical protein